MDQPAMPPAVVSEIERLSQCSNGELRQLWQTLYGREAPSHHRAFLERRLAWRLQEQAIQTTHRGLLERNRTRIAALVDELRCSSESPILRLRPGTVLLRIYRGVEHQVRVQPDGQFEYQGKAYRSLTVIAEVITGSRWSGPLFFGLTRAGKLKRR